MPVKLNHSRRKVKLEAEVRRMHTHTVVFKSGSAEEDVAVLARGGLTTKAIADATGLSESQAQYRILKAQREIGTRFRRDFRQGSELAMRAIQAIAPEVREEIQDKVTPKFLILAENRLNQ